MQICDGYTENPGPREQAEITTVTSGNVSCIGVSLFSTRISILEAYRHAKRLSYFRGYELGSASVGQMEFAQEDDEGGLHNKFIISQAAPACIFYIRVVFAPSPLLIFRVLLVLAHVIAAFDFLLSSVFFSCDVENSLPAFRCSNRFFPHM